MKPGPGANVDSLDALPLPWRRGERRASRHFLLFVTCALALNAFIGERGAMERWRARQRMREQASALADMRRESARLRQQIELLENDPRTIERVARAELGLVRRGEILVILKSSPR